MRPPICIHTNNIKDKPTKLKSENKTENSPFNRLERLFNTKQATKAALINTNTTPVIDTYITTDFDTSAVSTNSVDTTFSSPTSEEALKERENKNN